MSTAIETVYARLSATDQSQRYHIIESFVKFFPPYGRPVLQGYAATEHDALHLAAWSTMQTTLPFDALDEGSGELLFRAESHFLRRLPEQFIDLYALYWRHRCRAEDARLSAEYHAYNTLMGMLIYDSTPTSHLLKRLKAAHGYHYHWSKEHVEEEHISFHATVTRILCEAREHITDL